MSKFRRYLSVLLLFAITFLVTIKSERYFPTESYGKSFYCSIQIAFLKSSTWDLHEADITVAQFHAHPLPLLLTFEPAQKFIKFSPKSHLKHASNCEVAFLFHSMLSGAFELSQHLDVKSFKNPRIFSLPNPQQNSVTIETENFNIFIANLLVCNSGCNILAAVSDVKPKTRKSWADPIRNRHLRIGLYDLKPQYFHAGGHTVGMTYEFIMASAQHFNFTYDLTWTEGTMAQEADGTCSGLECDVFTTEWTCNSSTRLYSCHPKQI